MYPRNKQKQKEFDRCQRLAWGLLNGTEGSSKNGVARRVFLSANTKPTENEAREALCRILRYWGQHMKTGLLDAVAPSRCCRPKHAR